MPVHDWARVEAGVFHDFHSSWLPEIRKALNGGILPDGFYALVEQHAGRLIADLLTLHEPGNEQLNSATTFQGGTALAEVAPKIRERKRINTANRTRPRTLAIRHVSNHRLVAIIEIVSPSNIDRDKSIDTFVSKIVSALESGVNALVIDLFARDEKRLAGMHGEIVRSLDENETTDASAKDVHAIVSSYTAGSIVEMFSERLPLGLRLPDMPLFLSPERYVDVPLEAAYAAAYAGTPKFWRDAVAST